LVIDSKDYGENDDVEDGIRILLAGLPSDIAVWLSLTSAYEADVFCGIFLESENRGFGISPEVSRLLSDRNLELGFDIYFKVPEQTSD